ncbi:MAG: DUF4286 family protein [Chitinophagales bacterium]|nr:DUF4286 family protein [Chitinophagaceae bacterium]MCB9065078.1 DUF4286 family protein [Chitinophagales bacterium]
MIIYNVTIKVNKDAADEWVRWMNDEHMPELMETGLFTDSKLFRLLDMDESDGITYAAQYHCATMDEYNKYISDHAATMREKGLNRFKDKFVAFRTVMEKVK